jgi:serine protease AprX
LPVNPGYVSQVKTTGAKTFFTSRWWNGVLVEGDPTTLAIVNALPFVKESRLVAPGTKLVGGRTSKVKQRKASTADQPINQFQLQQLGLDVMQEAGYRGEGVFIAVFDSGFEGVNVSHLLLICFLKIELIKRKILLLTSLPFLYMMIMEAKCYPSWLLINLIRM